MKVHVKSAKWLTKFPGSTSSLYTRIARLKLTRADLGADTKPRVKNVDYIADTAFKIAYTIQYFHGCNHDHH